MSTLCGQDAEAVVRCGARTAGTHRSQTKMGMPVVSVESVRLEDSWTSVVCHLRLRRG